MKEDRNEKKIHLFTFLDISTHLFLTALLAWFFYRLTGRWLWPVLCFLGGVLIDLDHFLDYFRHFGVKFAPKDFFGHKQLESGRIYLYLHSWELVMLLWLLSFGIPWMIPLVSGMTLHLAVDQFMFHTSTPLFYFLLYRLHHEFRLSVLDPRAHGIWGRRISMELKGLEKLPSNVRGMLPAYIDELFSSYKGDIVSVFAYGSVTGPDYHQSGSDVNIAVVVKDSSLEEIKPALKTIRRGMKRKITAPLFLTVPYMEMSLDTFPIEFMNMKDTRLVLYGEDVLSGLDLKKEDLRRECEYQLKGKLLTLRQAFLEQGLSAKGMERLIKASLGALIPVFRAALMIKTDASPPVGKNEVLRLLADEFGLKTASFQTVLHDKETDGRIAGKSAEQFLDDFLVQLGRLSEIVDKI